MIFLALCLPAEENEQNLPVGDTGQLFGWRCQPVGPHLRQLEAEAG